MRHIPVVALGALVLSGVLVACFEDQPASPDPTAGGAPSASPNPASPNPTSPNPTSPNPTSPNPTSPNPTSPNPTGNGGSPDPAAADGGASSPAPTTDCGTDSPVADASTPTPTAACDPTSPFGALVAVRELNTAAGLEESISLSADELTAYFVRDKSLYSATRASKELPFATASIGLVANANQDGTTHNVAISHDGLVLYTVSTIASGPKDFYSTFAAPGFSVPAIVGGASGDQYGWHPYLNIQSTAAYYDFPTVRGGGPNEALYMATVASPGVWTAPHVIEELFSNKGDRSPVLSSDQLSLYFASKRDGEENIYLSTRATVAAPWGTPVVLPGLSTPSPDAPSWISDDGCRLYIVNESSGSSDIYLAKRGL